MANFKGIGISKVSRLEWKLRRMPDAIVKEVRNAIQDAANLLVKTAAPMVPRDQGDLADALHMKLGQKKLTAKVGYWQKGNKRNWKKAGYRAHWVLFGTKGGIIKSGPAKGRVIPPLAANNFLGRAWRQNRTRILNNINGSVNSALKKVSRL